MKLNGYPALEYIAYSVVYLFKPFLGKVPGKDKEKKKKAAKIKDFGTGWMDHTARHAEEAARIPAPYLIDLPDVPAEEDLRTGKKEQSPGS